MILFGIFFALLIVRIIWAFICLLIRAVNVSGNEYFNNGTRSKYENGHEYEYFEIAEKQVLSAAYAILGLTDSSSDQEVRREYRRLARKWHPDVNPSPDAVEHFRKVQEAYEEIKKFRGMK